MSVLEEKKNYKSSAPHQWRRVCYSTYMAWHPGKNKLNRNKLGPLPASTDVLLAKQQNMF